MAAASGVTDVRAHRPPRALPSLPAPAPDAEYYDWVKQDTDNEAVRKLVGDYWTAEEALGDGRKIFDSKVFK